MTWWRSSVAATKYHNGKEDDTDDDNCNTDVEVVLAGGDEYILGSDNDVNETADKPLLFNLYWLLVIPIIINEDLLYQSIMTAAVLYPKELF